MSFPLFAAYHYDSPAVTAIAALDAVVEKTSATIDRLEAEHGSKRSTRFFGKSEHGERIRASGHFSLVKTIGLHHTETTSAEGIVRGFDTCGAVNDLRRRGVTDEAMGLTALAAAAAASLGRREAPIYVSYVVHIGVSEG